MRQFRCAARRRGRFCMADTTQIQAGYLGLLCALRDTSRPPDNHLLSDRGQVIGDRLKVTRMGARRTPKA